MNYEHYKKLIDTKPWEKVEKHFDSLPVADVNLITTLDIKTQDWIQFTLDHFRDVQQKWEKPKEHYAEFSNELASVNNLLGRNEHNTHELNYGMNGDTNQALKELLGEDNIARLNVNPDSVLIRFIVKLPGHGIAWHYDDAGSYKKKFSEFNLDRLKRLWFPVQDWKDGHAFQISKTVLTHWKAGDVYEIPFGLGHASSNFGLNQQYTVSFTGVLND